MPRHSDLVPWQGGGRLEGATALESQTAREAGDARDVAEVERAPATADELPPLIARAVETVMAQQGLGHPALGGLGLRSIDLDEPLRPLMEAHCKHLGRRCGEILLLERALLAFREVAHASFLWKRLAGCQQQLRDAVTSLDEFDTWRLDAVGEYVRRLRRLASAGAITAQIFDAWSRVLAESQWTSSGGQGEDMLNCLQQRLVDLQKQHGSTRAALAIQNADDELRRLCFASFANVVFRQRQVDLASRLEESELSAKEDRRYVRKVTRDAVMKIAHKLDESHISVCFKSWYVWLLEQRNQELVAEQHRVKPTDEILPKVMRVMNAQQEREAMLRSEQLVRSCFAVWASLGFVAMRSRYARELFVITALRSAGGLEEAKFIEIFRRWMHEAEKAGHGKMSKMNEESARLHERRSARKLSRSAAIRTAEAFLCLAPAQALRQRFFAAWCGVFLMARAREADSLRASAAAAAAADRLWASTSAGLLDKFICTWRGVVVAERTRLAYALRASAAAVTCVARFWTSRATSSLDRLCSAWRGIILVERARKADALRVSAAAAAVAARFWASSVASSRSDVDLARKFLWSWRAKILELRLVWASLQKAASDDAEEIAKRALAAGALARLWAANFSTVLSNICLCWRCFSGMSRAASAARLRCAAGESARSIGVGLGLARCFSGWCLIAQLHSRLAALKAQHEHCFAMNHGMVILARSRLASLHYFLLWAVQAFRAPLQPPAAPASAAVPAPITFAPSPASYAAPPPVEVSPTASVASLPDSPPRFDVLPVLSPVPAPLPAVVYSRPVSPKRKSVITPQAICHTVPVLHTMPAPHNELVVKRRVVQQAPTPRIVEVHKAAPTQAVVLQVQGNTCVCGNHFMPDANFCRKCGQPRPGHGGASAHGISHSTVAQPHFTDILNQPHRLSGGAHPQVMQMTHAPQRCMELPGHH